MKTGHWIVIAVIVGSLAFFAGYKAASASGIEPRHFDFVETGGYGATADELEGLDLDKQTKDYYKDLLHDE